MNRQRRKDIDAALALISDARSILDVASDEEQDYFDNIPENMQDTDRAQESQEAIDILSQAVEMLDEVDEIVSTAKG